MLLPQHNYLKPASLDECLKALSEAGEFGQIVAGGTDVIFNMRLKLFRPKTVISIRRLPELARVEALPDGSLRIAAAVSNAVGAFIPEMPMTPWKVLRVIRQNGLHQ